MSFSTRESSRYGAAPQELYLFQTQADSWFFTSADEALVYRGATYTPAPMYRTGSTQTNDAKGGELRVHVPQDNPVAQLFVSDGPDTPVALTIFRKHEGDTDADAVVYFIGRVTLGGFTEDCELKCVAEQSVLRRRIPSLLYQSPCNRFVYGPGCDVDKNNFQVLATVSALDASGTQLTLAIPDGQGSFTQGSTPVVGQQVNAGAGVKFDTFYDLGALNVTVSAVHQTNTGQARLYAPDRNSWLEPGQTVTLNATAYQVDGQSGLLMFPTSADSFQQSGQHAYENAATTWDGARASDGWFTGGFLLVGTHKRFIANHAGFQVSLLAGVPGLKIGDQVRLYAGCDRTFTTCAQKFDNAARFFGFEWIPTQNPYNGVMY